MFKKRENVADIEEGKLLSPKFDSNGLIPVITTDCPSGPKETIQNGKFGLIVENDNDQDLYIAMNRALNNKRTMKKKVNESKTYMKRFYTEQVAEKYLNLFIN